MNRGGGWKGLRLWPRTLAVRLLVILAVGLATAHVLSFAVLFLERYQTMQSTMLGNLESDVATSIAILDRLPPAERTSWLKRLERQNYRYVLGTGVPGQPTEASMAVAQSIGDALGGEYPIAVDNVPGNVERIQVHLQLSDGAPVTIDVTPSGMPLASWLPLVLVAQLVLLLACAWLAVRLAIRPLERLAQAADALNPNSQGDRLSQTGPTEIAHAATAFNAMQDRIADYLAERAQMLAAISHDLQTPITRMKLRAELMDDSAQKEKLEQDLGEIQSLVQDGIAYARSAYGDGEKSQRIDPAAFFDSLVYDYRDVGQQVSVDGGLSEPLLTRPHALRRILTNLIDNALKFAEAAELQLLTEPDGQVSIAVLDRGPGIPEGELTAVMQPFYRLESSRNRTTGGSGLGLAIAHQLAQSLGGSMTLENRPGGGLVARLMLPTDRS